VKNHDFTPKNHFFPILGGRAPGAPPGATPGYSHDIAEKSLNVLRSMVSSN
jgi:hypothetical protein